MNLLKNLFGCNHKWYEFKGEEPFFIHYNGIDELFVLKILSCEKCGEAKWQKMSKSDLPENIIENFNSMLQQKIEANN